jgi:hypothetical protein
MMDWKFYTREEHEQWCKEHHVPPAPTYPENERNKRAASGRPLIDEYYDRNY